MEANPLSEEYFTIQDVAKRLKVSVHTVRRWIREGDLNAVYPGGKLVRIAPMELERFIHQKDKKSGKAETLACLA